MPMICTVDPETDTATYGLWNSINGMWAWYDVDSTDDDDVKFYLTSDIYLHFIDFEACRKRGSGSPPKATIHLVVNGEKFEVYSSTPAVFKPATRAYNIVGGRILQMGYAAYDNEQDPLDRSDTMFVFAVVGCDNLVTNEPSVGIYVPRTHGNISKSGNDYIFTDFDPTPAAFVTEDTNNLIINQSTTIATPVSKVNVWMPICGLGSECIAYSKIRIMGTGSGTLGGFK